MQAYRHYAADSREIDSLLSQLDKLLEAHSAELGEQGIDHELEWLKEWIGRFRNGNEHAKHEIDAHAIKMLVSIRNTLAQATLEEQRMQAESPLNSVSSEAHTTALRDTQRDVGLAFESLIKNKRFALKK
jgi:hypothetical protein